MPYNIFFISYSNFKYLFLFCLKHMDCLNVILVHKCRHLKIIALLYPELGVGINIDFFQAMQLMTQSLLWILRHHQNLLPYFSWYIFICIETTIGNIIISFFCNILYCCIYKFWLCNIFCISFTSKQSLFLEITMLHYLFSGMSFSPITLTSSHYLLRAMLNLTSSLTVSIITLNCYCSIVCII
jgi:hypothetical protein